MKNSSDNSPRPRWQFSLAAFFTFVALLSVALAFVVTYPSAALFVAVVAFVSLFMSGGIIGVLQEISKPSVYAKRPFISAGIGICAGLTAVVVCGFLVWLFWKAVEKGNVAVLCGLMLGFVLFAMISVMSIRAVWLAFNGPDEHPASPDNGPK
jgi:hypothetical protein